MAKYNGFIGCFIVVPCLLLFAATEATQYNVGGSFGWKIPPNQTFYSDWARSQRFFVGDTLVFNLTEYQGFADVTMVDYNNCSTTTTDPIVDSMNGTVFKVELLHPGPLYFICTVDDCCARGQKFSIDVESSFSSSSAQSSSISVPTLSYRALSAFLTTISVYFFTPT